MPLWLEAVGNLAGAISHFGMAAFVVGLWVGWRRSGNRPKG